MRTFFDPISDMIDGGCALLARGHAVAMDEPTAPNATPGAPTQPDAPAISTPPRGDTVNLPTHERPARPFPGPDFPPPAPPRVPGGCSCQRVEQRMQGGVFHMAGSRGGIEVIN